VINFLKDDHTTGSFALVLVRISNAALGFVFWIIAAWRSDASAVGIAIAFLAAAILSGKISTLGVEPRDGHRAKGASR